MASYLETAVDIAREAGSLLSHYYERRVAFELKGDFDLVTEADAKIKAIETILASEATYAEMKKDRRLGTETSTLSVLAQAIAEHDEASAWKATAPDVRDAARKVVMAANYEDAKKEFAVLKAAHEGKGSGAKLDAEWNKLGRLGRIMAEVTKRQNKLRRTIKKLPEDTSEAARDASVMATLGLAIHTDTHEVKNAADKPEWYKMALEFQASSTELSKALKAKDGAAAKTAFGKVGKSCADCHAKFKEH